MGCMKKLQQEIDSLVDKQTEGLIGLMSSPGGLTEGGIKGLASLLKVALGRAIDKNLVLLYDSEKEQSKQLENQDGTVLPEP